VLALFLLALLYFGTYQNNYYQFVVVKSVVVITKEIVMTHRDANRFFHHKYSN